MLHLRFSLAFSRFRKVFACFSSIPPAPRKLVVIKDFRAVGPGLLLLLSLILAEPALLADLWVKPELRRLLLLALITFLGLAFGFLFGLVFFIGLWLFLAFRPSLGRELESEFLSQLRSDLESEDGDADLLNTDNSNEPAVESDFDGVNCRLFIDFGLVF